MRGEDGLPLPENSNSSSGQARPKTLPPKLQFKMSQKQDHDLGNYGVGCPPPAGGEKIQNEPIALPTRPRKSEENDKNIIHCATPVGNRNRSYAPINIGTDQGSLGGTNLARIGPEENLPPPHPEPSMGPEAPGHQPTGGRPHHAPSSLASGTLNRN